MDDNTIDLHDIQLDKKRSGSDRWALVRNVWWATV